MAFELAPKLRAFVENAKAHFKLQNALNFFSGNTININIVAASNPKQPEALPLQKLTPELKEELRLALLEYHENGQPLLTQKSAELLEYVQHHKEEGKEVIDTLHGIIRGEDILALRASYIIKAKSKAGEDIKDLRDGIIRKYGERGRKLTNLCTSGYFEDVILPTYAAMKQADAFQVKDFVAFYEVFVDESGFAVFVNVGMTVETVCAEVIKKLDRNRSYGKYYVHVHGLGPSIVKTILKAAKLVLEKNTQIKQVNEARVGGSIVVRLEWVADAEQKKPVG